jgi:multiple sugar transport system substrate-binding protein
MATKRPATEPGPVEIDRRVAGLTRRSFLRAVGAATIASTAGGLLEACMPAASSPTASSPLVSGSPGLSKAPGSALPASPAGPLGFGSNHSDAVPKQAMQAVVDAFTAMSGIDVRVNTVDHATFQNQVSTYLQGRPDDVFTWFAGNRMRFFAERGLVGDVSDLWTEIGGSYGEGFRAASTGIDGRQYFVPFYNYPWVLLYRTSVWQRHGYAPPTTFDDLLKLARRMQADGLVPIAFGDREGWPAMGFFDILNLRLNGYAFHTDLLDGRASWLDPRVRTVFERWRQLVPFLQPAALGRTWQEGAQAMVGGTAGMFFAGTFAGEQAAPADRADLELAPFPLLGTPFDDEHAIDAPINGFMLAREPHDRESAVAFLRFVASGRAQDIWTAANPNYVAASNGADRSGYSPLQQRAAEIIAGAGRIAQFFDRDTRPDFAGQNGMQGYLQDFLADPEQDLVPYLKTIQDFWNSLG